MSLNLRYMQLPDIRDVAAIDKLCFRPPWSPDSYLFEINQSRVSHMVVLEERNSHAPAQPVYSGDGWFSRLSNRLRGESATLNGTGAIHGYGGLWKIEGEAHISTIATHPDKRGCGYGEILLAGMFAKALRLNAEYFVLEVRVSNKVAQKLYAKYGFSRFGRKRNYYRSDNEDAYDMRVTLDARTRRRFEGLYESLMYKHDLRDAYSRAAHPRF